MYVRALTKFLNASYLRVTSRRRRIYIVIIRSRRSAEAHSVIISARFGRETNFANGSIMGAVVSANKLFALLEKMNGLDLDISVFIVGGQTFCI
jgi:prolipoprotein diacylglyceryltransferase